MKATLYSPTGAVEYDPSIGLDRSLDNEPFMFPPVLHDPIDTDVFAEEDDGCTPWSVRYERKTGRIIGGFDWCSQDGTLYDLQEMATPHLFYALRMVWNHSVPRVWRVGNYKEYPDVPNWHPNYRKAAIEALANELAQRDDDLNEDCRQQLFEMVLKTIYIIDLGI
jgi:hypothetical protein